ncbi:MAG TPA: M48 family metallopeptidase [Armatimonadota bacterium]|nr:M48 family metallopeptidase [Armatimonadota bacterium]
MRKRRCAIALILFLGCSLLAGCKPKSLVSTSQEVEIGREASQQIEHQYPVNKDPQLNQLVTQIGQNLAAYSDRQDIQYKFKILDLKEVNAISLPGGWIYVHRGLIDATKGNRNELAGVIAHEIGHVAARHHADMIGRQTYAAILIGTLTKGDVRQIAGIFADISLLRWSRKHEYEADRLGIKYMFRSKSHDPEGLIGFFDKLLQMQGHEPSEFEQIFRTHPVTSERIARARAYLADLRAGKAE